MTGITKFKTSKVENSVCILHSEMNRHHTQDNTNGYVEPQNGHVNNNMDHVQRTNSYVDHDMNGYHAHDNTNGYVEPQNGHVEPQNGFVSHTLDHTQLTNGKIQHTNGFVDREMTGYMGNKSEQFEKNNVDMENTSALETYMNGTIKETQGYDVSTHNNAQHLIGLTDHNNSDIVTQSFHGRQVTADTQPHDQHTSRYDICDHLSSIGMDDTNEEDMRQIHQEVKFHDELVESQSVFQWTSDKVFAQDKDGDTFVHIAIILQELNLVMTLINTALSPRPLSTRNNLSQTPLILAVLTNQVSVVRRLMVGGAELVSRDRNGNTALHLACKLGYHNIVETLMEPVRYLETKMNTNYEIPYQKIPQDLEIANYEGKTALHIAVENRYDDIVKLLIEKRADINARDGKTGRTILHQACLDGNVDLVKYLLYWRDCNINARSFDDYTPFDFARIRGHTEIAILLAQAGARNRDDDDDVSD